MPFKGIPHSSSIHTASRTLALHVQCKPSLGNGGRNKIQCPRGSQLDSGLGNVRARQSHQCLHHSGTAYTHCGHEARDCPAPGGTQGPLHQRKVCEPALTCEENRAPTGNLPILVFSGKWQIFAAQCWAVHTGPTRGHQALMPSSWSLVSDSLVRYMHTSSPLEVILSGSGSDPPVPPHTKEQIPVQSILKSDKMQANNMKMFKNVFIRPITIGINVIWKQSKPLQMVLSKSSDIQNHFRWQHMCYDKICLESRLSNNVHFRWVTSITLVSPHENLNWDINIFKMSMFMFSQASYISWISNILH